MALHTDRVEGAGEPEHAERVIAELGFTEVGDEYFDRVLAALDEPTRPFPALAHAARQVADQPAFDRR